MKSIVIFVVKMSTEEDYRLREIQREYLDFLDDDVGASRVLYRCFLIGVKCQGVFKRLLRSRRAGANCTAKS